MKYKSTTVLAVVKDGQVAIGADGQATFGKTIAKSNVRKIRNRLVIPFKKILGRTIQ